MLTLNEKKIAAYCHQKITKMLEIMIPQSFCLTLLIGFTAIILCWYLFGKRNHLPPGPKPLPIVGNLLMLVRGDVLKTFRNLRLKFGDMFTLKIGSYDTVVVNGYDTLKELLTKNGDKTSDRPDIFWIKALTHNEGVGGSSGTLWKIHRTFALTTLRSFGLGKSSIEVRIMEEVNLFLNEIKSMTTKPINLDGLVKASVSNIICCIAFGRRFSYKDQRFLRLLELFEENFRLSGPSAIINAFPFLQYVPFDPFQGKRILKNVETIREFLNDLIKDHISDYDEDNIRDYIDAYLKEMNSRATFTDSQLTSSVFELFLAGSETVATSIKWAILFFLHYPEVQQKMKKEIDAVVGTVRHPSLSDRNDLPYCEAVITEVLRCGNIAPLSAQHSCRSDISFKGFTLPKGTVIIPNLDSIHYNPDIFDEPEKFRPERFLDANGKLQGVDKVVAFSIGRRVCVGETLARSELFLFLTSIVQMFKIAPVDPNNLPSLQGVLGITFMPNSYEFYAIKRE